MSLPSRHLTAKPRYNHRGPQSQITIRSMHTRLYLRECRERVGLSPEDSTQRRGGNAYRRDKRGILLYSRMRFGNPSQKIFIYTLAACEHQKIRPSILKMGLYPKLTLLTLATHIQQVRLVRDQCRGQSR